MPRTPSVEEAFAVPVAVLMQAAASSLIMGEHLARSVRGIACAPPQLNPNSLPFFS
jgi:hypothetical protein